MLRDTIFIVECVGDGVDALSIVDLLNVRIRLIDGVDISFQFGNGISELRISLLSAVDLVDYMCLKPLFLEDRSHLWEFQNIQ